MKIFSKFKQFSKDIKLIIITALIMSSFIVYAAGECIIAATADDVSYNGTTVQAAIDELYARSHDYCPDGYECTELNYVTDCDNKKIYSTTPDNLSGLAKIMAEGAYLDNGKSEYVNSCSGVNFNAISSDTNGKGIYEIASTKNDTYPIYYYRGAVDNNNVKFGGFCWKAIRTTDTGGVKMIYNGEPDASGNCTNTTGVDTQIGTSKYNSANTSPAYVGYMYGSIYTYSNRTAANLATAYKYGNDVTYSGGTYTLVDTMTSTGNWTNDYNTIDHNHYTCFSTGNTCSSVYYIYNSDTSKAYYITLTNGKKVEDALDDMFVNTTQSVIKPVVDNWYSSNLTSYTSYIEDTIYCNNRKANYLNGWEPEGTGSTGTGIYFQTGYWSSNSSPYLSCSREIDRFTVSNSIGNGLLTYPVGLMTSQEMWYAGGRGGNANSTYYLYTNQNYWSMSSNSIMPTGGLTTVAVIYSNGAISGDNAPVSSSYGVRPVISLKETDVVASGDGTSTNPYVIQTS